MSSKPPWDIISHLLKWPAKKKKQKPKPKTENNKRWQGCAEIGNLVPCWWNAKWYIRYGKQYFNPQSIKNTISKPTSGYISKRIESRILKKYLHTHVYSSITDSNQELESVQKYVVYTYFGIWFSLKKEGNHVTCYNIDESWGHYAKWNKPVTKSQTLYYNTYMN